MDQLCEALIKHCGNLARLERELEVAFDLYSSEKMSKEAYDKLVDDLDQRLVEIELVNATLKEILKDMQKDKADAGLD